MAKSDAGSGQAGKIAILVVIIILACIAVFKVGGQAGGEQVVSDAPPAAAGN